MVKCLECFRYGNPCKGGPLKDHKCKDFIPFGKLDAKIRSKEDSNDRLARNSEDYYEERFDY
jgi:hypothetical protein